MSLIVIKRVFNPITKTVYLDALKPDLATDVYLNEGFRTFFQTHAKAAEDGIYPFFEVRKLMWELRMKPLKRENWENSSKMLKLLTIPGQKPTLPTLFLLF